MEYHPYHNLLHQKVCDIIILGFDQNQDIVVNHFLYQTSLVRRILDTSKICNAQSPAGTMTNPGTSPGTSPGGGFHTFNSSSNTVARGFLVFIRKIANKMVEMQKANEEVASFLESIPEWGEYYEGELKKVNEIETKPLGQETKGRKKSEDPIEDDIFVMNFLTKFSKQQKEKKDKNDNGNDDDDDDDDILKNNYDKDEGLDQDQDLLEVAEYQDRQE